MASLRLTGAVGCWLLFARMKASLFYSVLVWAAAVLPVAAQTPATPGGVTRNGVVTLGTGSALTGTLYGAPATSPQPAPPTTTAGAGQGGGSGAASGNFGAGSSAAGNPGRATSARTTAGSAGSATGATSGGAPAWIVCPPSGALGTEPFLTGTGLSCAP
jgi:hypothetical protein